MPLDIDSAVDNLIRRGWSDDDIKTTIDQVNKQTNDLILSGKSDQEIEATLSQTKLKDKFGDVQLFPNPAKDIVDQGLANVPKDAMAAANSVLQKPTAQSDAQLKSFTEDPITAGKQALMRAVPFPGLVRALTGQTPKGQVDLGSIANPLPEILTDPIARGIEGLKNIKPDFYPTMGSDFANLIEGGMAMSPNLRGLWQNLSNLTKYDLTKKAYPTRIDEYTINQARDVSPGTTNVSPNVSNPPGGTRLLESPRMNAANVTGTLPLVQGEPPLKSKPSAFSATSGAIPTEIDPMTIEISKNALDYGLKIGNAELVKRASDILDQAKIPPKQRVVTPEQAQAVTQATIGVANEAKRYAQQVGDEALTNRANQIINNNGTIKPIQIQNPSVHDLDNFTANTNAIVVNKPAIDMTKLQGTSVMNDDGSPKEVYHGTPVAYDKFDLEKAEPGLYGTGLYFTEEPTIAGGEGRQKLNWHSTGYATDFGYATPRGEVAVADSVLQSLKDRATQTLEKYNKALAQKNEGDILFYRELLDTQRNDVLEYSKKLASPNVRPSYLNIKKPFDIDGKLSGNDVTNIINIVKQTPEYNSSTGYISSTYKLQDFIRDAEEAITRLPNETFDGSDIYDNLAKNYADKDNVNDILKQAGYDGITHIGGALTGNKPHRVWIAFDPSQVISKFDPELYSYKLRELTNNEFTLAGNRVPSESVKDSREISSYNDDITGNPPVNADISLSLIKRATDLGIESFTPSFNQLDWDRIVTDTFGPRRRVPPTEPPDGPPNIPSPPNLYQLMPPTPHTLRGLPWYGKGQPAMSVFTHLENESGIPYLTEMWNAKQIADSKYIVDAMKREKEILNTVKEVGRYHRPTLANEIALNKAGPLVEKIKDYDKTNNILHYEDTNGRITIGTPETFARAYNVNKDIGELAARGRYLFDKWWREGSTANAVNPNAYIDFYLPHKMSQQERFDYVRGLRNDQKAFFQHERSGKIFPVETNLLKILNRYSREWARVDYLTPWQKEVFEPILRATKDIYKDIPTSNETINYIINYGLDTLRMPRNTAIDANQKLYDFVDKTLRPINGRLADRMIRSFGSDDRLAEAVSNATRKFFLNYFLRFRTLPGLRNAFQRELALPFMPDGHIGMLKAQRDLWRNVDGAHDKVILSGLMPYLDESFLSTNRWDLFQHAENGNMFIPFLTIHNGAVRDFNAGMSWDNFKDKWRIHLYPDDFQSRWRDLYNRGNVGDIRNLGPIDNVAAEMGRYASNVTQFPKGPGETPEWTRSGPMAKVGWQFGTWSPMAIDYFARVSNAAYNGPKPVRDFASLAKIIGVAIIGDMMFESITGTDLGLNPISNLPDRLGGGPGLTIPQEVLSVVASAWNNLISSGIESDRNGMKKFLQDRAVRELLRNKPGPYSEVKRYFGDSKKERKSKSIAP